MKNIWRALSLTVFLIGLISFPYIHKPAIGSQAQEKAASYNDLEPEQSFVAKFVDSRVDPAGKVTVTGSRTRYVEANGEWREVIRRVGSLEASSQKPDRITEFAGTQDGVYEKKSAPASRRYVSEWGNKQMLDSFRSHYYLRNNKEFVRTEQVAGLVVYVQRTELKDPANQGYWIESSYSPKTGLHRLRTITHFSDGSEIRDEAVSVEFTEVPETLNDDLKSLPITQKEEKLKQN
jgi:hypothetical protein